MAIFCYLWFIWLWIIEDIEDEYNPTFLVKFEYKDDYDYLKEKLDLCIELVEESMEKVFKDIEGKEEEYK